MGGGNVFGSGVRVVVDVVCCVGACTGVILWGDSGSLGGKDIRE